MELEGGRIAENPCKAGDGAGLGPDPVPAGHCSQTAGLRRQPIHRPIPFSGTARPQGEGAPAGRGKSTGERPQAPVYPHPPEGRPGASGQHRPGVDPLREQPRKEMGGPGPEAGRGSHPVGGSLRRRGDGSRLRSPGAEHQEGQVPGQEQSGPHHPARRLRPADDPGGSPGGSAGGLGTLPRQFPAPGRRAAGIFLSAQRQPAPHRPQGSSRSTGGPAAAHPVAVAVNLRPAQPPTGPRNTTIGRSGRFPGNAVPGELGPAGHRRGGAVSEPEDPDLPRDRLPLRLLPECPPSRRPALLPDPARQGPGQDRLPVGAAHPLPGAAAGHCPFRRSPSASAGKPCCRSRQRTPPR